MKRNSKQIFKKHFENLFPFLDRFKDRNAKEFFCLVTEEVLQQYLDNNPYVHKGGTPFGELCYNEKENYFYLTDLTKKPYGTKKELEEIGRVNKKRFEELLIKKPGTKTFFEFDYEKIKTEKGIDAMDLYFKSFEKLIPLGHRYIGEKIGIDQDLLELMIINGRNMDYCEKNNYFQIKSNGNYDKFSIESERNHMRLERIKKTKPGVQNIFGFSGTLRKV